MSSQALTATMHSSPHCFSPGGKIHMSPAIYGLFHTGSHTWISYHVGFSGALSWFHKAPVFVSCMSTCRGSGGGGWMGGVYLCYAWFSRWSLVFFFRASLMCLCSKTACKNTFVDININLGVSIFWVAQVCLVVSVLLCGSQSFLGLPDCIRWIDQGSSNQRVDKAHLENGWWTAILQ